MARKHLDADTLERLICRELVREELRAAAWHLYKCRRCRGRLRQMDPAGSEMLSRLFEDVKPVDVSRGGDYSAAFGAATRCLLRRHQTVTGDEARLAARRLRQLLALPAAERRRAVEEDPRFCLWGVAEGLLEECRRCWGHDPAAEELAQLALRVVAATRVRSELRADLAARAWGHVGNCRRVGGDLPGSAAAFAKARQIVARGTGDPVELARLLDLEASLLRAQRRFGESLKVLKRASHLYRTAGDRLGEGRVLVKQAMTYGVAGRVEEAVATDRRALACLDPEADPRLHLVARYNLLTDLHELGRYDEVLADLDEVRLLTRRHGRESDGWHLQWFEGLLARDLGQWVRAEELLVAVRRRYLEDGVAYNAALVSLDLAVLLLEQGRTAETRTLAQETLPIFESQEVQREAWAAFLLFQRAAVAEAVTAEVARQAATAVRRGEGAQVSRAAAPPS